MERLGSREGPGEGGEREGEGWVGNLLVEEGKYVHCWVSYADSFIGRKAIVLCELMKPTQTLLNDKCSQCVVHLHEIYD